MDCNGCMTVSTYEKALKGHLCIPKQAPKRPECACFLGNDIGAYHTCGHLCCYCYANDNADLVRENRKHHNPNSPFLIGESLTDVICNVDKNASFEMDFVTDKCVLYRVKTVIRPKNGEKYFPSNIDVTVHSTDITLRDSYETCVKKIEAQKEAKAATYIQELEKIQDLSWMFKYPFDSLESMKGIYTTKNAERFLRVLDKILKSLDPAILKVEKSDEVDNTYIIRYVDKSVIIQDRRVIEPNILSSGTKAGIEIAGVLTSILEGEFGFYYCDEKFSYIHSDMEKAILSVMINKLHENEQLFFTTHNTDILDLPLPKHSFIFLQKDMNDEENPIKCISASSLLKRNTDCIKNAVENDLFSVAPKMDEIYDLASC